MPPPATSPFKSCTSQPGLFTSNERITKHIAFKISIFAAENAEESLGFTAPLYSQSGWHKVLDRVRWIDSFQLR